MKWAVSVCLIAAGVVAWILLSPNESTEPSGDAAPPSVLNRGIGPEPETVDPQRSNTVQAHAVLRDLFEGLLSYDASGELTGGVAETWGVSGDGLEYRFILRPTARWSNGDPLTAKDFVFSLRRLVDPRTAAFYADLLEPIVNAAEIVAGNAPPDTLGVTAVAPNELSIRLVRPTAHFLLLLTQAPTFPVHADSVGQQGERFTRPGNLISNGAYVLEEWALGAVIELRKNDQYWNADATAIDIVRHHVAEEPASELRRFMAGELDITSTVPSAAFPRMAAQYPNQLQVAATLGVHYFGFNLTKPKLSDNLELRQALSMAIDREQIAEQVVGRGELPAYSFTPPGVANYEPPQLAFANLTADERVARARRLFADAGYGPNNLPELELRYNTSETHQRVALAVQDMWRKVLGFEAELVNEEFKVLVANVQAMQITEIFRLNWTGDYNDAYSFLSIFESDNPSNLFAYKNADFDRLLESAALQTDPYRRRVFMEEAESLMLAEYPLMPIYFSVSKHMVSSRVRGWQENVLDYHYSQHLSIDASN